MYTLYCLDDCMRLDYIGPHGWISGLHGWLPGLHWWLHGLYGLNGQHACVTVWTILDHLDKYLDCRRLQVWLPGLNVSLPVGTAWTASMTAWVACVTFWTAWTVWMIARTVYVIAWTAWTAWVTAWNHGLYGWLQGLHLWLFELYGLHRWILDWKGCLWFA